MEKKDTTNTELEKFERSRLTFLGSAGLCAVFFIALLSLNGSHTESSFLLFSSFCFAIAMPIFIAFASIHMGIVNYQWSLDKIDQYRNNRLQRVILIAHLLILFAFISLLFHLHCGVGVSFVFGIIIAAFCHIKLAKK